MNKSLKNYLIKSLLILTSLCLFFYLAYTAIIAILPGFIEVIESGSEKAIETYIMSFGSLKGMLLAALLQFVQIMTILFPGAPIQIATGIIFGTFRGLIVCEVGYLLAYAAVFLVVRKAGGKLSELFGEDAEKKHKNGGFLISGQYPEIGVFIACLIPIMPNGLIPYFAAKTKISFKRFMLSSLAGSFPTLLMLCAIGNNLLDQDYLSAGLYTLILGCFIVYVLFNKKKVYDFARSVYTKAKGQFRSTVSYGKKSLERTGDDKSKINNLK